MAVVGMASHFAFFFLLPAEGNVDLLCLAYVDMYGQLVMVLIYNYKKLSFMVYIQGCNVMHWQTSRDDNTLRKREKSPSKPGRKFGRKRATGCQEMGKLNLI